MINISIELAVFIVVVCFFLVMIWRPWEEDKYDMIDSAWNEITRTWLDEEERIIKIDKPCN